ncbi:MAG TPA: hypothetical protein ENH82_18585 [bacterium]|nr:hypothetical protein [bacterium]
MSKKKWKSKKERQQWWAELTPEQQAIHLERWQVGKATMRRSRSNEFMAKINVLFNCKKCFHNLTKSCTDNLPKGCEYWFSPNSEIQGLAYE